MTDQTEKNNKVQRPPVVAVMGHVDHGKSSLLDYIRSSKIVEREAGGITQHVAAYEVEVEHGKEKRKITFIDTPGHEAFKAIRNRSAKIADIAILIISAEDGIKAQTLEALEQIRNSKTPFIVAINKIDLPNAKPDEIKYKLAEHGVLVEGVGGNIPVALISAKKGTGVNELLELILLTADLEGFSADPNKLASGFVVESAVDNKKGTTATLVVKDGTLKKSSFLVCGKAIAPVRLIENIVGKSIEEATFCMPIKIAGWSELPPNGEEFLNFNSKIEAEEFANQYVSEKTDDKSQDRDETRNIIPLIIKADVASTIEAVKHEIEKIPNDRSIIKIILTGTGNVSESDIKAAGGNSKVIVIGFNTKVDSSAETMAERLGITIYTSNIIYKLSEWLAEEIIKRTPKQTIQEVRGKAKVLKTFSKNKDKQIIGARVLEGIILLKHQVNIIRREALLGSGKVLELQKFKAQVNQVDIDTEFGTMIESKIEIAVGDILECIVEVVK